MLGVIAAVDDLLFGSRIQETARRLHVPLRLAGPQDDLTALVRQERPALLILDLHCEACRPLEAIRGIKADPVLRETPVLGVFSHVRHDLEAAAVEAGCDQVLPRSAFTIRLPEILQHHAAAV